MPRLDARGRTNQSDMDADTKNLNVNQDAPFLFDNAQGKVQEIQVFELESAIVSLQYKTLVHAVLQEGC